MSLELVTFSHCSGHFSKRQFLGKKMCFLQRALDFNAANPQKSHYYERQGILHGSLCCQSVNNISCRVATILPARVIPPIKPGFRERSGSVVECLT